jgi:polysaccharide pyruvyl transferase WcaK-like protein
MTPDPVSSVAAAQPAAPRILVLGASFATPNRGVAALAGGIFSSVFASFPDAQVSLLDYAKDPQPADFTFAGRTHRIDTVALRFSRNLLLRNHVLRLLVTALLARCLPESRGRRVLARNPWLRPIVDADIVGAISGGDSFTDRYGLRRLLYVALPQLLVLATGRPLVLLPQNFGPFRHGVSRVIARAILSRAGRIFSRDRAGVDVVARLCPRARARTASAIDFGFALEAGGAPAGLLASLRPRPSSGPVVGVNVSGLLLADATAGGNAFRLRENYAALMRDIIVFLVERKNCSVVLVPHVFGAGAESDVLAAQALRRTLPEAIARAVRFIPDELDQHAVKQVIGQFDLFIGSRMHACIAALSQGVPCVALAYSEKFAGVLESVAMDDLVIDLRATTRAHTLAIVDDTLSTLGAVRARLARQIPPVREAALGFFRELSPSSAPPDRAVAGARPRELHPA